MLLSLLQTSPMTFLYIIVAILIAITFHEFAHAFIATRLGDPTPRMQGRVTLNPLAHLDPIGTLTLLLAGFGWGKPVVYNPMYVRKGRWGEVLIAIAGPVSNLILAFLFALPYRIMLLQGQSLIENPWLAFTSVVVEINILLAAFNLIPIPPLDGSKILYLILDNISGGEFNTDWLEHYGPVFLLIIIFAQIAFGINILFRLIDPLMAVFRWLVAGVGIPSIFF